MNTRRRRPGNTYQVSAGWLYKENGQTREQSLSIVFKERNRPRALGGALKWVQNRGEALSWGNPCYVQVRVHPIGVPEASGYIRTGGAFHFFEWKYDTSPMTFQDLLRIHTKDL